jgi:Ycf66 protein N-terminus
VVENMLAYILAVLVGTGSVGLYIAAFFFPEIHRKHDFIWSGVGFFYALTLWIYARQSMGGIVVGQTASVALVGWFAWQTLKLRRQLVPANQQTPLPDTTKIKQQLGLKPTTPPKSKATNPTPSKSTAPQTVVEVKPTIVKQIVDTPPAPPAVIPAPVVEVKPTIVKQVVDTPPAPPAVIPAPVVEVKPTVVKQVVDKPPAPPAVIPAPVVEVKPTVVKQVVDTPPAPPVVEEEKASITLQLEPPATAVKPLGQPVKPPAPPERPQQGILAAGAIVEVAAPLEDINKAIDLEVQSLALAKPLPQQKPLLQRIEPIDKPTEEPKDESRMEQK